MCENFVKRPPTWDQQLDSTGFSAIHNDLIANNLAIIKLTFHGFEVG